MVDNKYNILQWYRVTQFKKLHQGILLWITVKGKRFLQKKYIIFTKFTISLLVIITTYQFTPWRQLLGIIIWNKEVLIFIIPFLAIFFLLVIFLPKNKSDIISSFAIITALLFYIFSQTLEDRNIINSLIAADIQNCSTAVSVIPILENGGSEYSEMIITPYEANYSFFIRNNNQQSVDFAGQLIYDLRFVNNITFRLILTESSIIPEPYRTKIISDLINQKLAFYKKIRNDLCSSYGIR